MTMCLLIADRLYLCVRRLGLALALSAGLLGGAAVQAQGGAGSGAGAGGVPPVMLGASKEFLSSYKLGPGDVLTIRVFGEDDLSREKIRLTDTGSLFLPGVGEIVVLGKTLGEVERLAVERLKGRILVNPQVSVFVEEYRPFFINGMVDRPGGYPFQPGLTVRKAAALAGGFKERASMKKIFLISATDPQQRPVNVDLNAPVLPGDIVTVEESFF
ncbi:polysaccharide biosynthesis/export family protein [Piscinibacter sakaiensis]|uniref:Capsular polysaccharide synthesis enzyme CpsC n=1 Tax=Piscinibacter sakaiensis TaxID=1547922 RepID=A0A0K8NZ06_PISS1|nr:polysaccharide biosynthesis/export family protein [Piscinibacter sakaiensis]GAP35632.1 capsular polysaccharide synthesis enzyme CpsC [Piscinibacter sakaiensis]